MRRLLPHPHYLLTDTRTNKKWTYHNNNYHDNDNDNDNYLYHLALAIHLTPLNLLSSMNRSNPPFFTTPSIGSTSWRFHLWLCTPLMPSMNQSKPGFFTPPHTSSTSCWFDVLLCALLVSSMIDRSASHHRARTRGPLQCSVCMQSTTRVGIHGTALRLGLLCCAHCSCCIDPQFTKTILPETSSSSPTSFRLASSALNLIERIYKTIVFVIPRRQNTSMSMFASRRMSDSQS